MGAAACKSATSIPNHKLSLRLISESGYKLMQANAQNGRTHYGTL